MDPSPPSPQSLSSTGRPPWVSLRFPAPPLSVFVGKWFAVSEDVIWYNFCEWYKIRVQFHSFACAYPIFLVSFIEGTILSPIVYSLCLCYNICTI